MVLFHFRSLIAVILSLSPVGIVHCGWPGLMAGWAPVPSGEHHYAAL